MLSKYVCIYLRDNYLMEWFNGMIFKWDNIEVFLPKICAISLLFIIIFSFAKIQKLFSKTYDEFIAQKIWSCTFDRLQKPPSYIGKTMSKRHRTIRKWGVSFWGNFV